ncbi:MAG TPA: YkgJ family cysteine cluster protein [Steroidobacteraceae bacterium]|nr:YkgJ family cysteine cluster protein [Steroidobacteraceae bacterium]
MEIVIDSDFVDGIVAAEEPRATLDIASQGPIAAQRSSCQRHDERLALARDAATLACKAGCSWCCHFSVDVRPAEVLNMVDYMEQHFTPAQQAQVRRETETNAAMLTHLSELQRMQRNVKCPFLAAGRCSIYSARPQTCRNYHATDVTGCELSYQQPGNLEIDPDFAPYVYQAGGAHVDAFSAAMQGAGYDVQAYELNAAVAAALADPQGARQRFETKQRFFPGIEGREVAAEFIEPPDDSEI